MPFRLRCEDTKKYAGVNGLAISPANGRRRFLAISNGRVRFPGRFLAGSSLRQAYPVRNVFVGVLRPRD